MKISDLQFPYPDELIATEPKRPSRVMWYDGAPSEISIAELLQRIPAGDVFVVNQTKVLKRRVFTSEFEIVFLRNLGTKKWEVLFPAKKLSIGDQVALPEGRSMRILEKGRPQTVVLDQEVDEAYFERVAELPLPPYIQKARGERKPKDQDQRWYQTSWAKNPGSLAAPTASLHLTQADLDKLKARGVDVVELTLHVGLGTFLPVLTDDLNDHPMHEEYVEIPSETISQVIYACENNRGVWALGTTVARALESVGAEILKPDAQGNYQGMTNLLIQPGFQWNFVNRLLTNFHQPESTLLALVAGFTSLDEVKKAYAWAIERNFRLFSYGDLTVWMKK